MEIDTFQDALLSKLIAKFCFYCQFYFGKIYSFSLFNKFSSSKYVCFFSIRIDKLSIMVKTC